MAIFAISGEEWLGDENHIVFWLFSRKKDQRIEHWKPLGTFLPQALRSKLREIGTLRLIPKTLALIAVHRQTAASVSASPWSRVQHGLDDSEPTTTPIKPPSRSAHTPSFKVSLGQVALLGFGLGVTGFGLGVGFGFGLGLGVGFGLGDGLPQVPHPLTQAKKTRLSARKRAREALLFETIFNIISSNEIPLGTKCLKIYDGGGCEVK
ncbi:hypothetical protein OSB04_022460 [Centaurea solstitialis]|uniref:Uncharacterized protein n=1 Tax=Centaurea solstitialis TaxID=347529 RepID=A0AA38W7N8_9ASTR|nr:hypothetical protein OSB04_022460 [Centaurea solstitialis]